MSQDAQEPKEPETLQIVRESISGETREVVHLRASDSASRHGTNRRELEAHARRLTALAERYEQIAAGLHSRHQALIDLEQELPGDFAAHARSIAEINAWWQAEHAAVLREFADVVQRSSDTQAARDVSRE